MLGFCMCGNGRSVDTWIQSSGEAASASAARCMALPALLPRPHHTLECLTTRAHLPPLHAEPWEVHFAAGNYQGILS